MARSFVLLFAVGIILAEISWAKPTGKYDESDESSSDEYDSDYEDTENEKNPALICLLFGDHACHAVCAIKSQLFKRKSRGYCDSDQKCNCHNYGDESLHKAWKKIFDAEYVYRKIIDNDLSSEQAVDIFSHPFKTAEEYKEKLYPMISPYQFSQLKINDTHSLAKYTKAGKFDKGALQKYVKDKLEVYLKSNSGKFLLNPKYKEKFRKALEDSKESKATLYNFTFRVKQLQNKTLENVLEDFLKKKKIEKPKIEIPIKNDGIIPIIDTLVLNELVKQIEEKSKDSTKKPAAAAKRPSFPKRPIAGSKKQ